MISVHTLVKNEENFLWYSVMSVVKYVDKILIWDTGSTDNTCKIIQEIVKLYPKKVFFREVGEVDEKEYSNIRQQMLDETPEGWIFVLDGDEIWWDENIKIICNFANTHDKVESIIVPTVNLIGDMYHYQDSAGGQYIFGDKKGHLALRFINRNIPGLHVGDIYGKEGYFDNNNTPIQNRDKNKMVFLETKYLHTTHLQRSTKDNLVMQRKRKLKYENGLSLPFDFYYPEVFFRERPEIVNNIWINTTNYFKFRAGFETPIKKFKRKIK